MTDIRKFTRGPAGPGTAPPRAVAQGSQKDDTQVTNSPEAPPSGVIDMDPQGDDVIKSYLEYLADHDITEEDIREVLDSILTSGEVYWKFQLLGKIPVTFKMRPAWVNDRMLDRMDQDPPKTQTRFFDLISMYNLAGSMVEYGTHKNAVETEDDLDANIEFIYKLPYILQSRLVKKMAIFDRVVAVATSDWAIENFTKPLPEK